MTRVAAFDTSTWTGSVALVEGAGPGAGRTVRELAATVESSHAASILALLERILAEAGWPKATVDAYASTRGPGSFTGLRVGLGTIRGLSLASGRPALGIGTLDAMAETVRDGRSDRIPMLDAGRGEVFGARFDAESAPPREVVAAWVGPVERAVEGGEARAGTVIAPEGFPYLDRLRAAGHAGRIVPPDGTIAAAAGRIALARLGAQAPDGDGLAPLYVRPADAELKPPSKPRR